MNILKKNWRQKTLEDLENDVWGDPPYDSHLVKRTHQLRKLPLAGLTNDDLAMMLRQNLSLTYIVPLAIDKLQVDILAYGDAGSEGAIMNAILKIPGDFWKTNRDYWITIKKLLDDNQSVWTFEKRDNFDNALCE